MRRQMNDGNKENHKRPRLPSDVIRDEENTEKTVLQQGTSSQQVYSGANDVPSSSSLPVANSFNEQLEFEQAQNSYAPDSYFTSNASFDLSNRDVPAYTIDHIYMERVGDDSGYLQGSSADRVGSRTFWADTEPAEPGTQLGEEAPVYAVMGNVYNGYSQRLDVPMRNYRLHYDTSEGPEPQPQEPIEPLDQWLEQEFAVEELPVDHEEVIDMVEFDVNGAQENDQDAVLAADEDYLNNLPERFVRNAVNFLTEQIKKTNGCCLRLNKPGEEPTGRHFDDADFSDFEEAVGEKSEQRPEHEDKRGGEGRRNGKGGSDSEGGSGRDGEGGREGGLEGDPREVDEEQ